MEILETEKIWDRLKNKYYDEWLKSEEERWPRIRLKLAMVNELKETIRKIDNA